MDDLATNKDPVGQIVEILREEIVSGVLPPGAALAQEHLAARFGISRMPIREAIKQLQSLGFVTVEPTKRARVAAVSRSDFLEIYDMRIAAETLAIRSAIPLLSNAQIEKAAVIQAEIETTPPNAFGDVNMRFHMALYTPSARPRLLDLIANLGQAADRYMFMCTVDRAVHDKSNREHHQLLTACKARDEAAAVDCIARHIGDARDLFAPMLAG